MTSLWKEGHLSSLTMAALPWEGEYYRLVCQWSLEDQASCHLRWEAAAEVWFLWEVAAAVVVVLLSFEGDHLSLAGGRSSLEEDRWFELQAVAPVLVEADHSLVVLSLSCAHVQTTRCRYHQERWPRR